MSKLTFACAILLALTACGGGGSGSTSSFTPSTLSQNQGVLGSGTLSPASGTIGAGYIECDTAANIAAGNNCNNYANFTFASPPATGGTFTFTAIAATASGTPIAQQMLDGSALSFPNGSYRVAESPNDSPAIVSISGGPWPAPGTAISASGSAYGNAFTVRCVRYGTANLRLELVSGTGAQPLPFASSAFAGNTATVNCSASAAVTVL